MTDELDVLERATIHFPEKVTIDTLIGLFEFFNDEQTLDVSCEVPVGRSWSFDPEYLTSIYEECTKDVTGNVCNNRVSNSRVYASENFRCPRECVDRDSLYSFLRFDIIPGYSVEEHRRETVALWDDVRELTKQYFENAQSNDKK